MQHAHRYFMINKPYGMLSQFVTRFEGEQHLPMLGALDFTFPEGTHAVGRLDKTSEGLLLLTTNTKVTRLLFLSKVPHARTYLVKVKNKIAADKLELLRSGVPIQVKGGGYYMTTPCQAEIVEKPAGLFERPGEPDDYGKSSWLLITLTEGKFHQIRKMVQYVRHPCLRLVRISIEDLALGEMAPGEVHEIDEETFFIKLKLESGRQAAPPRYNG